MSEEKIGGHNPDTGFEQEDLSPQGVFYFMGGVVVLGVVIYFIRPECIAISTTTIARTSRRRIQWRRRPALIRRR